MARYLRDPQKAAAILRFGGILAYPTEAVYGLGCDPINAQAVQRLLQIKGREVEQGLILIAAELSQLSQWLNPLPAQREAEVLQSWPGHVTWLWPAKPQTPHWLTGKHSALAVRITDHPTARALCSHFNGALISTSANRHGQPPARSAEEVERVLGKSLDAIVDAPLGTRSKPSEIRDALTGAILRPG
ncbi:L-threonylcarbamoyladenylate synthase [Thiorhodospira sibirica]|uniref:L-threonylcarbamoyladenylate synthase n=1 Tax=Thiorhodospira sibirica TaxID=154347 RepID=UPI00022C2852|nr:Sua5/YciO/YrdC/YwlC family protein [Thiorhodospira sibirica]